MKNRVILVVMTAAVFGGGLAAGLWIGRNEVPATPPPAWLYSEFNDITTPGTRIQEIIQSRPDLWREINAELRQLKPRIDEFRARLKDIDSDFRRDLEAVLTDEQKTRLAEAQARREIPRFNAPLAASTAGQTRAQANAPKQADKPAAAPSATQTPASAATSRPEPTPRLYTDRSDGMVSSFVFVPYTTARFVDVLGLDEDQEEKLNVLLTERRTRFLQLCDDMPPPSLQLNRIADIIRKGQAADKAGSAGKP